MWMLRGHFVITKKLFDFFLAFAQKEISLHSNRLKSIFIIIQNKKDIIKLY